MVPIARRLHTAWTDQDARGTHYWRSAHVVADRRARRAGAGQPLCGLSPTLLPTCHNLDARIGRFTRRDRGRQPGGRRELDSNRLQGPGTLAVARVIAATESGQDTAGGRGPGWHLLCAARSLRPDQRLCARCQGQTIDDVASCGGRGFNELLRLEGDGLRAFAPTIWSAQVKGLELTIRQQEVIDLVAAIDCHLGQRIGAEYDGRIECGHPIADAVLTTPHRARDEIE